MKSGIYKILNLINGKFYIGSAVNFKNRWRVHKFYLKNNNDKRVSKYLLNAWNKYGADAFEFVILEYCEKDKLIEREQYWMDTLKPEYNISHTAGSPLGTKHTEKFKINARNRQLSRVHTEEHNKKIAESNKKPKSEKHKLNISLGKKNKKDSPEKNLINSFSHRNFNKWPCVDGIKCRCEECKEKKKNYMKEYRLIRAITLETSERL